MVVIVVVVPMIAMIAVVPMVTVIVVMVIPFVIAMMIAFMVLVIMAEFIRLVIVASQCRPIMGVARPIRTLATPFVLMPAAMHPIFIMAVMLAVIDRAVIPFAAEVNGAVEHRKAPIITRTAPAIAVTAGADIEADAAASGADANFDAARPDPDAKADAGPVRPVICSRSASAHISA